MLGRRKDVTPARGARLWLAGAMALGLAQAASAAPAQQDAARDYDTQDARLNAVYKKLSQSLDDAGRKALREEERQWIAGRDQSCGVPAGSVVKNACTTTQTSFRADELQKRLRQGGPASSATGGATIVGDWGYRSDCNMGHSAQLGIAASSAATAEGTWSDGTRNSGNSGQFKGEWRDGKLYVRFCAEDAERGGYPVCPAFGEVDAYVAPAGKRLDWYRADGPASEGKFSKYVTLDRVPKGGKVPLDTQCKDEQ
ncbi:MAG: lysozyme inhibitor LprI family protein [Luteibacter sp.]